MELKATLRYSQEAAAQESWQLPVLRGKPIREPTLGAFLMRPTPRGFADLINPFAPLPEGRRAADMYDKAWLGDRPLPRLFDPEKTMEPEGIRIK